MPHQSATDAHASPPHFDPAGPAPASPDEPPPGATDSPAATLSSIADFGTSLGTWWIAAALPATAGIVLFGMAAARMIGLAVGVAMVCEVIFGRMRWPGGRTNISHAGLMGLLLALTLPAGGPLAAAAVGAIVAVGMGKLAMRGMGRYVWQPALVGRIVVQFVFAQQLSFSGAMSQSAILTPAKLVFGEITSATAVERGAHQGWGHMFARAGDDAILMEQPVQALRRLAEGGAGDDPASAMLAVVRDELPPWEDTLIGVVPGGIGQTASVVLLVATLYLIWRGVLRWPLPCGVLIGALLAAWICPIKAGTHGPYVWWPGSITAEGWPVGVMYVLFHLTGGQLLLAMALLAGDPTTSPNGRRGQWLFGFGVGALTIFMRLYGLLECESHWPIIAMNTLVPVINKVFSRRTK